VGQLSNRRAPMVMLNEYTQITGGSHDFYRTYARACTLNTPHPALVRRH
jgi:hypothetical protein